MRPLERIFLVSAFDFQLIASGSVIVMTFLQKQAEPTYVNSAYKGFE